MSKAMKNGIRGIRDFILRIRNHENESVRRRWLIVFTVPTFLVVILLWAAYVNASIKAEGAAALAQAAPEEPGFFEVFGLGLKAVGARVARGAGRIRALVAEQFAGPTIEISSPDRNFIVEDLPEIPLVPVPEPNVKREQTTNNKQQTTNN